jgi:GMP synthase-like glutamine amidotransferase
VQLRVSRDLTRVLVVDLGAQYAQLIARRVREAHIYSEIVAHDISPDEVRAKQADAIILSGGPKSVNEPNCWTDELMANRSQLSVG